jgi:protein-S-isoprenylcysteine O-methyltransferase Ste14
MRKLLFLTGLFLVLSQPAFAYIGPGAGISVLGGLLGILTTIIVALGAILFWPIRKMLKKKKASSQEPEKQQAPES